jgi:hypothetical protein
MDEKTANRLDRIVGRLRFDRDPDDAGFWALSLAESYYVALAANRPDLLDGCPIVDALKRVGDDWLTTLTRRWRHGTPSAAVEGYLAAERESGMAEKSA